MTLYAKIHKAIKAEALETMNAEMKCSLEERADSYGHEEPLSEPSSLWQRDSIVDDMTINTMNSLDMGDNEIFDYNLGDNDDKRIFSRFIEGTLRAMAYEMLDRYMERQEGDN
tara:strand:- start:269 stop:607 length:339 start_codon:yes stop_codon:yes gene_type:complete